MVKAAKMGYFERAKEAQSEAGLRALIVKAGVPEDHVDYFVKKWVESAKACDGKEGAEMEECYKAAVEWHHHHETEHAAPTPPTSSAKPSDGGCYNAAGTHEIVCESHGADEGSCGGMWIQSCSAIGHACCGGTPATPEPPTSSAKLSDGGCYNAAGTHEIVCESHGIDEGSCG